MGSSDRGSRVGSRVPGGAARSVQDRVTDPAWRQAVYGLLLRWRQPSADGRSRT